MRQAKKRGARLRTLVALLKLKTPASLSASVPRVQMLCRTTSHVVPSSSWPRSVLLFEIRAGCSIAEVLSSRRRTPTAFIIYDSIHSQLRYTSIYPFYSTRNCRCDRRFIEFCRAESETPRGVSGMDRRGR